MLTSVPVRHCPVHRYGSVFQCISLLSHSHRSGDGVYGPGVFGQCCVVLDSGIGSYTTQLPIRYVTAGAIPLTTHRSVHNHALTALPFRRFIPPLTDTVLMLQ